MKTLINELERMNFDANTICMEEGYLLVYKYVRTFYNSPKFSFIKSNFEFEDILDDIYATCIKRDLFNKFQLSNDYLEGKTTNTGKKSYVKLAVQRMLIDISRYWKDKLALSTDAPSTNDEDYDDLYNIIPDSKVNIQNDVSNRLDIQEILDSLDETKGKATGFSPILGESKLNEKTALIHILNGYNVTEIASMYTNNGKPVARTYVSKLIKRSAKHFESLI